MDEAVDLDAIAADVEPAQPFVSRSYTAALQEVVKEHLLIFAPIEGEGGIQLLLHRRSCGGVIVQSLVEGDDLILREGILGRIEVGSRPRVEVGDSSIVLLLDDLSFGTYQERLFSGEGHDERVPLLTCVVGILRLVDDVAVVVRGRHEGHLPVVGLRCRGATPDILPDEDFFGRAVRHREALQLSVGEVVDRIGGDGL